ncbi:hypothetical protein GCM10022380_80800 [Amycolatopsis tucumanensis]|uniref:Uncharacterized protein n=1 Tax=Amycolatopsis tucumanensis TaxID=401106 RepID=A0ABP7JQV9_9PSEU
MVKRWQEPVAVKILEIVESQDVAALSRRTKEFTRREQSILCKNVRDREKWQSAHR